MKTLRDYLVDKEKAAFARQLGISASLLSQYMSGYRNPGRRRMAEIEEATNGEVPVSVWIRPPASPPSEDAA